MNDRDLASLLGEHALRHAVPGAAIGVLRDGAISTAYYGIADVRTGEPVSSETLFSVGSLTKTMVATVIAQLDHTGRLSFDDPVAAHVPELRASGWAQAASLRDLLANRSRLPMRDGLEFGFAARRTMTARLAGWPRLFPRGRRWLMSGRIPTLVGVCRAGRSRR